MVNALLQNPWLHLYLLYGGALAIASTWNLFHARQARQDRRPGLAKGTIAMSRPGAGQST
jgi:hypothetical protein